MNMTDVEYFVKVAELMSFSKAAEALYVTQQAVSLHVKHLEDTYGVRLFERKPSLRLTPAGKRMLEAARDISEREQRLISEFSSSRDQFDGEISIGLPPNRSTAFVNEFFPVFCKAYPRMSLRLDERTSSNLSAAVRHNEIDIALPLQADYTGEYDPDTFQTIPLETESLYLVISDDMLRAAFPELSPPAGFAPFTSDSSLGALPSRRTGSGSLRCISGGFFSWTAASFLRLISSFQSSEGSSSCSSSRGWKASASSLAHTSA